jgi:hypothetical protein
MNGYLDIERVIDDDAPLAVASEIPMLSMKRNHG